jgi:glycosyltransferase involved in cell wall biosynthesis
MNQKERRTLLVITPRYPYPVVGGDRLRIYELCRYLSRFYSLTLLSLCETLGEMNSDIPDDRVFNTVHRVYLPKWRSYLNAAVGYFSKEPLQVAYYRSHEFRKLFMSLSMSHDGVLTHLIRMGSYLDDCKIPQFVELTDAISLNYSRVSNDYGILDFRKLIYTIERKRVLDYEISLIKRSAASFLVSDYDRDYLNSNGAPVGKTSVYSNGVRLEQFPYHYSPDGITILFIGNLYSMQNLDAVQWFARRILPILTERLSVKPTFKVVGKAHRSDIAKLNSLPGVFATGPVDNVAFEARNATVAVCPVRIGAGIQNKILEYISLGIPTVTTKVGFEGLDFLLNEHILVADTEATFAELIIEMFHDEDMRNSISAKARRHLEKSYSWDSKLGGVEYDIASKLL